jgi:hypothetical protein
MKFIAGLDDRGQAIPLTPATLRRHAATWPLGATTPDGIAGLLKTSRNLYICSYFAYEFLTIGVLASGGSGGAETEAVFEGSLRDSRR